MNKEIGRKLTSLTLLSILLASGVTFAIPGVMPVAEAAHNANLFVSSENSQYGNYFAGPQVVEIIVNDNDIKTLDDVHGQPDVTVNGKDVIMVQATDGNWYGYVSDKTQVQTGDQTQGDDITVGKKGLDFGDLCSKTSDLGKESVITPSDTVGVAVPNADAGINGTQDITSSACTDFPSSGANSASHNNVIREFKQLSNATTNRAGQIGLDGQAWPFVQLYDFSVGGNVIIQYNKGGNVQTTTLTFDTIPSNMVTHSLDRTNYPQSAQVHVTMTDPQLNIDPTDEDSWTWTTNSTNSTVYYQAFNENGDAEAATSGKGLQNLAGNLTSLMFEKNGKVTVNLKQDGTVVAAFGDNNDQVFGGNFSTASQQMTFVELSANSGVLANYDETDNANLDITSTAERGKSATIRYNDITKSVVVGFGFGTLDINVADGDWGSGEEVPVTLVDSDPNKNSRADEDLDLFNPNVALIPSLQIGNPFTLDSADIIQVHSGLKVASATEGAVSLTPAAASTFDNVTSDAVDSFSKRAIIDWFNATAITFRNNGGGSPADSALVIDYDGRDLEDLRNVLLETNGTAPKDRGLNLFNYDIRSLSLAPDGTSRLTAGSITNVDVYLLINATGAVANTFDLGASGSGNGFGIATGDTATITAIKLADRSTLSGIVNLNGTDDSDVGAPIISIHKSTFENTDAIGLMFVFNQTGNFTMSSSDNSPIVADFFSFGISGDGLTTTQRSNNAIYRFELEETGDNTSTFIGTAEYTMLNQLNIFTDGTFSGLRTIDDEVTFIVHEDLTDEDAPRVNYLDLGADGVSTQIADQQDGATNSGVVSFDKDAYKVADTVTITLEDADLNVDSDLIDIYVTVDPQVDPASDAVGKAFLGTYSNGDSFGRLLDITFDDLRWVRGASNGNTCTDTSTTADDGLDDAGFTLVETGTATGVFKGDFQIPSDFCDTGTNTRKTTTGTDIEVNYVDFRDASGELIEVGDGGGVRANTGSISLDRTVYPTPFGDFGNFAVSTSGTPDGRSLFPVHATGVSGGLGTGETIGEGALTIHVRVTDPDFDISAAGEDKIQSNRADQATGPVKITISRGSDSVILAFAGGPAAELGTIDAGTKTAAGAGVRETGPITEIAPNAGIFELDLTVLYTDGPASSTCPTTTVFTNLDGAGTAVLDRFDVAPGSGGSPAGSNCILQGDIITVEYTDPTDASGDPNTITDSATFDLRNGVLQSDKSVYIIGADMIMTLIEPDLDLDSDSAESYDLDLIEWDSDAATITMGNLGGSASSSGAAFDPEPSDFRETGDSSGIFQIVIEIPNTLDGERLDRGEEIELEYTDWGPSGADFVGDEDEDINLTIYTSNFGATVELDQKVYSWTDKVFITIVAPDHNFDSNLVDEIGDSDVDKVQVATRGQKLSPYKLVETGSDTGIFTGEVILTGFSPHDADGDGDDTDATEAKSGSGPTDGFLPTDDDDGLTVSFEFTEDETVVGSALIRWNIGEVQWLEASYPATGQGVIRVVDADLNLNPEAVDNFEVDVWSDSDAGGIDLTVTETNEATGIFEGTVFFTVTDESSGHRLRVAEGDTATGEYEDNTLPSPYTTADELDVTATTFIGTVVPPLERAPASNPRVVDAFGNELDEVSVDQQVQIAADLANGQDRDQPFAYLVQISKDGVTYSLSWITGSLAPGQSLNPAQSWTPTETGTYDVQIFVWESVDNPDALSPPVETTVTVV